MKSSTLIQVQRKQQDKEISNNWGDIKSSE